MHMVVMISIKPSPLSSFQAKGKRRSVWNLWHGLCHYTAVCLNDLSKRRGASSRQSQSVKQGMAPMETRQRPNSIPVIAWSWIIGGVLMLVLGIITLAAVPRMSELMSQVGGQRHMSASMGIRMAVSNYILWLTLIQSALSVAAVFAGIYFLRLRAWARGVLELLSWLTLFSVVAMGFIWFPLWMAASDDLLPRDGSVDLHRVKMIGTAAGGVVMVIAAIPLMAMIRSLRGKAVREAMLPALGKAVR